MFFFRAGQWVDFFIPGVEKVGGFSMWSPPSKLENESKLELAIKASTWPPANWVHTQAKIGSKLSVKIGKGSFILSHKFGLLTPLPMSYFHALSLRYLCHKRSPPLSLCDIIYARTCKIWISPVKRGLI